MQAEQSVDVQVLQLLTAHGLHVLSVDLWKYPWGHVVKHVPFNKNDPAEQSVHVTLLVQILHKGPQF